MEANLRGRASGLCATTLFRLGGSMLAFGLRVTGIYQKGVQNALDIALERVDFWFDNLPKAFDGFSIIHISDTHFDVLEGTSKQLCEVVSAETADLCVFTGDFCDFQSTPINFTVNKMRSVLENITSINGTVAVLGNHDSVRLVDPLEELGVRVLVNETIMLHRDADKILITGTDDVHTFNSSDSVKALAQSGPGFKIALVHSPEIADFAANAGYALYLAGHTHGGQVCFPGGRPIISGLKKFKSYYSGVWKHQKMHGYTSPGVGVSNVPVRFHSTAKVALFTLRRNAPTNNEKARCF